MSAPSDPDLIARHLELDSQVALRPEPFGALAYHYRTRRLIFLKHPDIVTVVRSLAAHDTVGDALEAAGIEPRRWPAFASALRSLLDSEILCEPALAR